AVAREVHHVDVGGAQGDAFLEDARAFVGERIDEALDDLLIGDVPRLCADLLAVGVDDPIDFRIGNRLAPAGFVAVPALAGLLPEAAELRDAVADAGIDEVGALLVAPLADLPADVEAGQVAHGEGTHGHAPLLHGRVDLLRRAALVQQEQALLEVLLDHPVADEAVAHA